jgi:colicin import membrane protein
MRGSLVVSVILHSALLASVLFTIKTGEPPRIPELEPLAVDLVTPSDVTRLRQGSRTAKQMEAAPKETPKTEPSKKDAEKPKPTPTVAPPPPPPPEQKEEAKEEPPPDKVASVPPPKADPPPPPPPAAPPPVPAPDEQKKLDDLVKEQEAERRKEEERKEQERKAEEQKKREEAKKAAEAKKKAEEKKKREAELKKKKEDERKKKEAEAKAKNFGEDMAALLNKIPDKGAPAPSTEFTAPNAKKGPVLGAPEGRDRTLSASELAILAQIIKSCVQSKWTVMSGGEGADQTIVKIRLRFNPDGRLAGAPTVMNQQNSPLFLAVSDSALRAVQACEPFPLPADKYDVWKDIVLNFDPKDMFGR